MNSQILPKYTDIEIADIGAITSLDKDRKDVTTSIVTVNYAWRTPLVTLFNVTKKTKSVIMVEFDFFGPKCYYRTDFKFEWLKKIEKEKKIELL